MDVTVSNRDVDLENPFQFIEGMDIELSDLEDDRNLILQHTQDHDQEYWNLRWSAPGSSVISRYGVDSDTDFEDAFYSSLRALDLDDSLDENIDLIVDDGKNTAVYHCGMENVYEGMKFDVTAGEMLKRISSKGRQSRVSHGDIEYFEVKTDEREFIWEKGTTENHYGILGKTPVEKGDLYLLDSSLPVEEQNGIDLGRIRRELQTETAQYGKILE